MKIRWERKRFNELSSKELQEIYLLRSEVFVVEQDCVYQDIDRKDEFAEHILGSINTAEEKELIAYARFFEKGKVYEKEASIGRFVVRKKYRGKLMGEQLMKKCIEEIGEAQTIKINAQQYLEKFYNKFGFKTIGEPYLWDGIWHIDMIR